MATIIERILSDANAQAEEVITQAKADAEKSAGDVLAAAEKQAAEISAKAQTDAAELIKRKDAVCELEMRKAQLGVKREMIDAAFNEASVELTRINEKQYSGMMLKLLENCAGLGDGEVKVAPIYADCFEGLLEKVEKSTGAKIKLAGKDDELEGGFIYSAGGMEVNCSFESILRQQRDTLEMGVHDLLFGGE